MTTYLDAAGAVREWANSLSGTLVGAGAPMPMGVSLKIRDGAATVSYGYLIELPAALWGGAENPSMAARISMQIYGPTRESAASAAIAYGEALIPLLTGQRAVLTSGPTILSVDNIDGPSWFPDNEEPRYIVDATFFFQ